MGSINFCEFSACSFSYFNCLFLSLPRSSLRSFFFFAATAVAFSSASLALVSASSAMAPSQDRHSASPATLLSARHPSQATSIFLVAVVPEAMLAHLKHIAPVQPVAFPRRFVFVSDNLPECPEDKHLSVRKAPIGTRIVDSTSPSGNVPVKLVHRDSLNCCILFTATTRNTILHHPLKVPCCFVSNLWTRELWNDRLHRPSQLVLEIGINALGSLEATLCTSGTLDCSHATHLSS